MRKILEVVACAILLAGITGCDDCPTCRQQDYTTTAVATDGSIITTTHHCSNGHCYSTSVTTQPAPVVIPAKYQTPAPPPVVVTVTDPAAVTAEDAGGTPPPPVIAAVTGGTTYGILVGINKFKSPDAPTLQGCDNDSTNIQAKAVAVWGLTTAHTVLLQDEQATKAAVVAALTAAVAAAKPGDKIIYWQSSHGATDTDPTTGDLVDVVCCYDFDWVPEYELTSTEFKAIFGKALPGVIIGWGSDSCHSGDLDKNLGKHVRHCRPKSPNMPDAVRIRVAKARAKGGKSRSINRDILNVGFMSGCKTDQTSADSSDENGVPCGAFTHYFLKDYDACAAMDLIDFATKVDADLAADGYDQTPLASGSQAAKPWLGGISK